MGVLLSFLFNLITDPLGLPIAGWKEWLILLAIGSLAYLFAYTIVGDLYRNGGISTGVGGSLSHWLIRLLIFIILWAVTYGVIWIGKQIFKHWVIAIVVLIAFMIAAGITVFICTKRKRGSSNARNERQ